MLEMQHGNYDPAINSTTSSTGRDRRLLSLSYSANMNDQHNKNDNSRMLNNGDLSLDPTINASIITGSNVICDDQSRYEVGGKDQNGRKSDAASVVLFPPSQLLQRPRPRHFSETKNLAVNHFVPSNPIAQTASAHRTTLLKHPTPDLQNLQGAHKGTIEHLERTAEQLSMTPAIEDAIKDLHDEQKRSDSRKNSLISPKTLSTASRNITSPSILEMKNASRPGSYSSAESTSPSKTPLTNFKSFSTRSFSSSGLSRTEPEVDVNPAKFFTNDPFKCSPLALTSIGTNPRGGLETRSSDPSQSSLNILESFGMSSFLKDDGNGNKYEQPPSQTDEMSSFKELSPTEMMEKMFADFEGFQSPKNSGAQDDIAENHLSLGLNPQSRAGSAAGQNMVFYPAPVPVMLNLPQKLSKKNTHINRNAKLHASTSPVETGNARLWESEMQAKNGKGSYSEGKQDECLSTNINSPTSDTSTPHPTREPPTRDRANLPAPLRASTFFDQQSQTQVFQLKDKSAVATLDSILDASANAPVWAFTDHAFVGALGPEVYGRKGSPNIRNAPLDVVMPKKRTSSFGALVGRNNYSGEILDLAKEQKKCVPLVGSVSGDPEAENDDPSNNQLAPGSECCESEDEEQDDEIYHGLPTTLLAELQLRKQRQKQRTQPLTKTFPNGIHSTLLELDTAIQTEQNTRRKERTILAWEDPNGQVQQDDDDVPLAMLYPCKPTENRPLGLLERRALEDNEPLSQRRNRLHGGALVATRPSAIINTATSGDEEEEKETLGERAKRLKATKIPLPLPEHDEFADAMMSQFGSNNVEIKSKDKKEDIPSKNSEEEETLGQRRRRLQAEREARAREVGENMQLMGHQRPFVKSHDNTADILSSYPNMGRAFPFNYEKPVGGLLAIHEKQAALRSANIQNFDTSKFTHGPVHIQQQQQSPSAFRAGFYNDGQGGITSLMPTQTDLQQYNAPFSSQPTRGYFDTGNFPLGAAGISNNNTTEIGSAMAYTTIRNQTPNVPAQMQSYVKNLKIDMIPKSVELPQPLHQPIEQGQMDRVERWRQSVTPSAKPVS